VGVDYGTRMSWKAHRRAGNGRVHFVTAGCGASSVRARFRFRDVPDHTWGTMSDKEGVLSEMRRLCAARWMRLLSVFSTRRFRRDANGTPDSATRVNETPESLLTDGVCVRAYFTEDTLAIARGDCTIVRLAGIRYAVTF